MQFIKKMAVFVILCGLLICKPVHAAGSSVLISPNADILSHNKEMNLNAEKNEDILDNEEQSKSETAINIEGTQSEMVKQYHVLDILTGNVSAEQWNEIYIYYVEKHNLKKVPLFNQCEYRDVAYGEHGTVASHGCGIVSVAMVASYLQDETYSVEALAEQFGEYNTEHGSYWTLFEDSARVLGLGEVKQTQSWKEAREALTNGQVVICVQREGLFTSRGHYIVLTGMNDDGTITVNDPNGGNYTKNKVLENGFKYGFDESLITDAANCYWIYEKKYTPDILIEGNEEIIGRIIENDMSLKTDDTEVAECVIEVQLNTETEE